jgi:hypothetical protein
MASAAAVMAWHRLPPEQTKRSFGCLNPQGI